MSETIDRTLYNFAVKKQIEKSESKKDTDASGKEITITTTIRTGEPAKFKINFPDRKLRGRAELYNAKTVSEYTAMGIMPISLVAKRFGNDGGPLTDREREFVDSLQVKSLELQKEFYSLAGEKEDEKMSRRAELATEIIDVREKIAQIQNSYLGFFENTAEIKARKKLIDWWVVHLIEKEVEVEVDKKKVLQFKPIVDGKTADEKIDALYDMLDSKDPFIKESAEKASYLIAFWFSASADVSAQEFEAMEEVYSTEISNYEIIDDLAPKPAAVAPPVEKPVDSAAVAVETPKAVTPTT